MIVVCTNPLRGPPLQLGIDRYKMVIVYKHESKIFLDT